MDQITEIINQGYTWFMELGMHIKLLFIIAGALAFFGQLVMYIKAGQVGISCIVPVWNIISFLRIVGRPDWHIFLLLIPGYNIYLICKLFIELAQSFGRKSFWDYLFVIVLNGFYTVFIGFNDSIKYQGPVYRNKEIMPSKTALA